MTVYALDGISPEIDPDSWAAPDAQIMGRVRIGPECSIWFGVVLRGDNEYLTFGAGTNLQENVVCHSDPGFPLTVGAGCTIGHKAMLHGCTIGDGALIGMGATVLNGAVIGRECLVGAGALVTEGKEIPDRSLVVGAPGRVIRTLTDADVEGLAKTAQGYISKMCLFRESLTPL